MTALTQGTPVVYQSTFPIASDFFFPVAASAKFSQGALVGLNVKGYLDDAFPGGAFDPSIKIIGFAEKDVDNTGGADGATLSDGTAGCPVTRGTGKCNNATGTDAVTQAHIGQIGYLLDDQTVSASFGLGARPVGGIIRQLNADNTVYLETIPPLDDARDELVLAGADLHLSQYFAVDLNAAGAAVLPAEGGTVWGVLQNAPLNGAVAIVRRRGVSSLVSGAVIAIGSVVAAAATGKAKVAVALVQATGSGSYGFARALTLGANSATPMQVDINHCGLQPSTYS